MSPQHRLKICLSLIPMSNWRQGTTPTTYRHIQLSENVKLEAGKGATEREKIGTELEDPMVEVVNPTLDPHEQLQFLVIVKDDWIPENGFFTPTQKIRRNVIEDTYGPNDAAWYGKKEKVIWHGW